MRPGVTVRQRAKAASLLYDRWQAAASSLTLRVLVWGPSPKDTGPLGKKRKEIRTEIERGGHQVLFSEDLTSGDQPISLQELAHLDCVECVVNFAASYGAIGEAHEYAHVLREKLLLWLHEDARQGFIGAGLAQELRPVGTEPIFFRDGDVSSCVIAAASADWIESMRGYLWGIKKRQEELRKLLPPRLRD